MTQVVFAKQVLLQPLGSLRSIIRIVPIPISNLDRTLIDTEQGTDQEVGVQAKYRRVWVQGSEDQCTITAPTSRKAG